MDQFDGRCTFLSILLAGAVTDFCQTIPALRPPRTISTDLESTPSSQSPSRTSLFLFAGRHPPSFKGLPNIPNPYVHLYRNHRKRNDTSLVERKIGRKIPENARALRSREENIKVIIGDAYYCPEPGWARKRIPSPGGRKSSFLSCPMWRLYEKEL